MMSLMIALLLLGVLVFVHEFGHYIVAKISGMRVESFSIGMGPTIASFKKGETNYIIGAIPAGGYVSVTGSSSPMDGEDDLDPDDPRRYPNCSIIKRSLFAFAGPFMNFLLAFVLLVFIFMNVGIAVPKQDSNTIVSQVSEKSMAEMAGIKAGDEILSINNEKISTWTELNRVLDKNKDKKLSLSIKRGNELLAIETKMQYSDKDKKYLLGVSKSVEFEHQKVGFKESTVLSLKKTKELSTMILDAVGKLATGKTSINNKDEGLTGPVGIIKIIDESSKSGIWNMLILMAALSLNLGLINLLPIPALDGSKLVFLFIEGIRGRPISAEKEGIVNFIGFVFLMGLMIYVTYNDVTRLF